jgi:hypothetical protein
MLSIRWEPSRTLKDREGNHAVLVQGAFREGGRWIFVVIDSNHSRPQVHSFDELGLFGARSFDSVESLPEEKLPAGLRAVADPVARMRRAVNLFYGKYAALRSHVPWYKRIFFGPVNWVRERLGLEPVEPEPVFVLDPGLIPLDKVPRSWERRAGRGFRFPPELFVTGSDGRRYLNRYAAERLLAGR